MPEVSAIGVVGAGFMGSGIAESAAAAGVQAIVFEPQAEPLERSRTALETSVAGRCHAGSAPREEGDALIERVTYTSELDALDAVDAVIEAVTEDPRVKGKLFAELDRAAARRASSWPPTRPRSRSPSSPPGRNGPSG